MTRRDDSLNVIVDTPVEQARRVWSEHGQKKWRAAQLDKVPAHFRRSVYKRHADVYAKGDYRQANLYLLQIAEKMAGICDQLDASANDADVCERAEQIAVHCQQMAALPWQTPETLIFTLQQIAGRIGAELPEIGRKGVTEDSFIRRLCDARYWRRQLRCIHIRRMEAAAIELGMVRRGVAEFVSDEALARIRGQRRRNQRMLETTTATNQDGQEFTLAELSATSVANPAIRKAELMTRVKGLEQICIAHEHAAFFVTLTCPSRFHSHYQDTGKKNAAYKGATPRDAQAYLNRVWQNIRSAAGANRDENGDKDPIHIYGFRGVEPHHDGCPHWHMCLYCEQRHAETLQEIIAQYALRDSGREVRGNPAVRIDMKPVDWSRGTPTAYILFYVTKNIDGTRTDTGETMGDHDEGGDNATGAERVRAWASVWGIRQFQLVGTSPVMIWRALRRLQAGELVSEALPGGADDDLAKLLRLTARREKLREQFGAAVGEGAIWSAASAADVGDWAAFVQAMGGHRCGRGNEAVRPVKDTGIVNAYGEATGERVIGVVDAATGVAIRTQVNEWEIKRDPRSGSQQSAKRARTRVNNCHRTPEQRLAFDLVLKWKKQERATNGQVAEVENSRSSGEREAADAGGGGYQGSGWAGGRLHRTPTTITGRRRPARGIAGAFG